MQPPIAIKNQTQLRMHALIQREVIILRIKAQLRCNAIENRGLEFVQSVFWRAPTFKIIVRSFVAVHLRQLTAKFAIIRLKIRKTAAI